MKSNNDAISSIPITCCYLPSVVFGCGFDGLCMFSWVFLRPISMYMCNEHGQGV